LVRAVAVRQARRWRWLSVGCFGLIGACSCNDDGGDARRDGDGGSVSAGTSAIAPTGGPSVDEVAFVGG
jgi:hypothetical protein